MNQAHQLSLGVTGDSVISIVPIGGRESHGDVGSDTPIVVGAFAFNPNDYAADNATLTLYFRAVAANGNTPLTTHVKLVNVTDADDIVTLDFVDTTSLVKQETALTIGAGAGEVDASEKIYEVQIYVDAPAGPSDSIELHSVELRAVNTVN